MSEEEIQIKVLSENIFLLSAKSIYEKLKEYCHDFKLPFEKIDPNSMSFEKQDSYWILQYVIFNQFNSRFSGKAILIYDEENKKILGTRNKLTSATFEKIISELSRFNSYISLNKNEKYFLQAANTSLCYNGFYFSKEELYYCPHTIKSIVASSSKLFYWKNKVYTTMNGKRITNIKTHKLNLDKKNFRNAKMLMELMGDCHINDRRLFSIFKILTFENKDGNNMFVLFHYLSFNGSLILLNMVVSNYKMPKSLSDSFMISFCFSSKQMIEKFQNFFYKTIIEQENMEIKRKQRIDRKTLSILLESFDQVENKVTEKEVARMSRFIFECSNKIDYYGTNIFCKRLDDFKGHYGLLYNISMQDIIRRNFFKVKSHKDLVRMFETTMVNTDENLKERLANKDTKNPMVNYEKRQAQCLKNFSEEYREYVSYKKDDDYFIFNPEKETEE